MAAGARVCVGQIGAPHGLRGEVRLRSFTADPQAIAGYGPLETEDGRVLEIVSLRPVKDHFVAALAGIGDRDTAAQLANAKLYVPRERLPQVVEADEFYQADLIGLAVIDRAGDRLGAVVAIYNFGAGDLIEVRLDASGSTVLVAFDDATVPIVDLAAGRIVVDPPAGTFSPSSLPGGGGGAKPTEATGAAETSGAAESLTASAAEAHGQRSTPSGKESG